MPYAADGQPGLSQGRHQWRHLVRFLRDNGALSADGAIAIDRRGGLDGSALRSLLRGGAVIESELGRFWFDDPAYKHMWSTRSLIVCAAVGAAAVLLASLVWLLR